MHFKPNEILMFKKRFSEADLKNVDVSVSATILLKICQDLLDFHSHQEPISRDKGFPMIKNIEAKHRLGGNEWTW